jgi:transcriptional regulator with XRE-family HTH domain
MDASERRTAAMESLNTAALGLAVRFAREELKLTSNDLAAQTGITPSSLSRSERGLRMLDLDEAGRVAKVLGMTIDSLVERSKILEKAGVVRNHMAALQDLSRALDAGRAAASAARNELVGSNE